MPTSEGRLFDIAKYAIPPEEKMAAIARANELTAQENKEKDKIEVPIIAARLATQEVVDIEAVEVSAGDEAIA